MNNDERLDAVMIAVLAVTIAVLASKVARSLSFATLSEFGTSDSFGWYLRLRVFEIQTEVFALGAFAYVVPRTRFTAVALRLAAAFAVFGIAAQVGQTLLEHSPDVAGGGVADAIGHLAEIVGFGAVIAMWFVTEHRATSREIASADLS